jgi:hypothetical protein
MRMVVSRKCKSERIIGWKLCESKTEGIFGCNMGAMGVMVEDAFLDVRGHISHTILGDVTRTSTAETDTVSVLCALSAAVISLIEGSGMRSARFVRTAANEEWRPINNLSVISSF